MDSDWLIFGLLLPFLGGNLHLRFIKYLDYRRLRFIPTYKINTLAELFLDQCRLSHIVKERLGLMQIDYEAMRRVSCGEA